jgi:hypothetical protein
LFPFYKQLVAAGIGLIIMTTLTIIDYRHIRSLSVLLYLGGAASSSSWLFLDKR